VCTGGVEDRVDAASGVSVKGRGSGCARHCFGDLGNAVPDSRYRIQSLDDRIERSDTLGDLGADPVDALIQCVVVHQLL
jgi:hypothetical protein